MKPNLVSRCWRPLSEIIVNVRFLFVEGECMFVNVAHGLFVSWFIIALGWCLSTLCAYPILLLPLFLPSEGQAKLSQSPNLAFASLYF